MYLELRPNCAQGIEYLQPRRWVSCLLPSNPPPVSTTISQLRASTTHQLSIVSLRGLQQGTYVATDFLAYLGPVQSSEFQASHGWSIPGAAYLAAISIRSQLPSYSNPARGHERRYCRATRPPVQLKESYLRPLHGMCTLLADSDCPDMAGGYQSQPWSCS